MLFILTGDIQTGKTRWLQRTISRLEEHGVTPYGVVAPGTWIERVDADGSVSYEKTGIDNELLPQHEIVPFARRADLALSEGRLDQCSQAQRAQLAWAIEDDAIAQVNSHFEKLCTQLGDPGEQLEPGRGILIVDELGRLELMRNEGLVSAMRLIDEGASEAVPHALVIVREQLLDLALERFANADWNGVSAIGPGDEAEATLLETFAV